jgi:hypothetical protein
MSFSLSRVDGAEEESFFLSFEGERIFLPNGKTECLSRCIGRIVAESVDSFLSVDGRRPFPRRKGFGTLSSALAGILSLGGSVSLVRSPLSLPCVTVEREGEMEIHVHGEWNSLTLHDICMDKGGKRGGADSIVYHNEELVGGYSFLICADGIHTQRPLPPSHLDWRWVIRSPLLSLRVSTTPFEGSGEFRVFLYRGGILWKEERVSCSSSFPSGFEFHVDFVCDSKAAVCGDEDYGWIPPFPSLMDDMGSTELSLFFLVSRAASFFSSSSILCALARSAYTWRHFLSEKWVCTPPSSPLSDPVQELANLLRDTSVSDDFLRLVDGGILLLHCGKDDRINTVGLSILRRMQLPIPGWSGGGRESSILEFSVSSFAVLPLTCERYSHLYSLGVFSSVEGAGAQGVLVTPPNTDTERVICVPNDSTSRHITSCISSLLRIGVEGEELPSLLPFEFGSLYSEEGFYGVSPGETVYPYRVRVDERGGVFLLRDFTTLPVLARHPLPVDSVSSVPVDRKRSNRIVIKSLFPSLSRRIELQRSEEASCLREVQCRRVSMEWSLESLDGTRNASSLGLSLLLALTFGGWMGARVRVFLGVAKGALFGYWSEGGFLLVDPAKTVRNSFDMSPFLSPCLESGYDSCVRKGLLLEVKATRMWNLALVLYVERNEEMGDRAHVRFASSGKERWIPLHSSVWRRVSRDEEESDIDLVFRSKIGKKAFQTE